MFNLFGSDPTRVRLESIIALDGGGFAALYTRVDPISGDVLIGAGPELSMFSSDGPTLFNRIGAPIVLDTGERLIAMVGLDGGGVETFVSTTNTPVSMTAKVFDDIGVQQSSTLFLGRETDSVQVLSDGFGPFSREIFLTDTTGFQTVSTATGALNSIFTAPVASANFLKLDDDFAVRINPQATTFQVAATSAAAGPVPTLTLTNSRDFFPAHFDIAAGNNIVRTEVKFTQFIDIIDPTGRKPIVRTENNQAAILVEGNFNTQWDVEYHIARPNGPEKIVKMATIDRADSVLFAICEIEGIGFASLQVVFDLDTGRARSANVLFFDFDGDLIGSRPVGSLIGKSVAYDFRLTALEDANQHGSIRVLATWSESEQDEVGKGISAEAVTFTGVIDVKGTVIDDQLRGLSGNDALQGLGGRDTILGLDGDDVLLGDAGADWLEGGDGDDLMTAGAGNDRAFGGAGNDELIYGGAGNDRLFGGDGDDRPEGGIGADTVHGDDGDDGIRGEEGNDVLFGDLGNDSLGGDDGNDTLQSGDGLDTLEGGRGNDFLLGDFGDDSMNGGLGNDDLIGGEDNDALDRASGRDHLYGGDGDDVIRGSAGADTLFGGLGNDHLSGGTEADKLVGDDGNDSIFGNSGNDSLSGDHGSDSLTGAAGKDTLNGGDDDTKDDLLFGGSGADMFVFKGHNGHDTISDFGDGADRLSISVSGLLLGVGATAASVVADHAVVTSGGVDLVFANTTIHLAGLDTTVGLASHILLSS
jgi:Ca2+-binding RTX toxin-like protein